MKESSSLKISSLQETWTPCPKKQWAESSNQVSILEAGASHEPFWGQGGMQGQGPPPLQRKFPYPTSSLLFRQAKPSGVWQNRQNALGVIMVPSLITSSAASNRRRSFTRTTNCAVLLLPAVKGGLKVCGADKNYIPQMCLFEIKEDFSGLVRPIRHVHVGAMRGGCGLWADSLLDAGPVMEPADFLYSSNTFFRDVSVRICCESHSPSPDLEHDLYNRSLMSLHSWHTLEPKGREPRPTSWASAAVLFATFSCTLPFSCGFRSDCASLWEGSLDDFPESDAGRGRGALLLSRYKGTQKQCCHCLLCLHGC